MFQQETRQIYERLRNAPLLFFTKKVPEKHRIIKTLKHSVFFLKDRKHGALIVIERSYPLQVYAGTGILINANLSKELLLNIFFPKSPLHDGAVIIRDNKIVCAGAVLPFTHTLKEYMGTRHKSALGLSEITDAIVLVVSEERGSLSIFHNGKMHKDVEGKFLEEYLQKNI